MIVDLTTELAAQVASRLSLRDRTEVLACLPDGKDLAEWVVDLPQGQGPNHGAWAVMRHGVPVAMGGVSRSPGTPWMAVNWAVGTDAKMEAGAWVMRAALAGHRRFDVEGVCKYQCSCLDSPELSSRWLVRLGYLIEGVLANHGRNGETFKLWGRINHGT
jgi:hypothetical protein